MLVVGKILSYSMITFEEIIEKNKNYVTEDGLTIEHLFGFWSHFRYNQIKWNDKSSQIPIYISHAFEEKEQLIREGVTYKYLGINKNINIPTYEQKNALIYLFNNDVELGQTIIDFIFQEYSKLREYYNEPEDMPKISSSAELNTLIELTSIFILYNNHEEISFIGFYFGGCQWDDEHGLGVLTHKNKIVKFGQIEDATDERFRFL